MQTYFFLDCMHTFTGEYYIFLKHVSVLSTKFIDYMCKFSN